MADAVPSVCVSVCVHPGAHVQDCKAEPSGASDHEPAPATMADLHTTVTELLGTGDH